MFAVAPDPTIVATLGLVTAAWRPHWELLVVPLILPVALEYGVHPIHLGIVFLAAMELGYLTPPVGLNLFISSYRFEKDITEVYAATVPFLLVLLFCVVIIAYVPDLSLWLLS